MSVVAKLVSNASQIILDEKDCIERINPFARRAITSCLILLYRTSEGNDWHEVDNRVLAFVGGERRQTIIRGQQRVPQ
jgi:hypothetical protein